MKLPIPLAIAFGTFSLISCQQTPPIATVQFQVISENAVQLGEQEIGLANISTGLRLQGQNSVYRFNQIAQVTPPSVNGLELRATHVTSQGNKVLVSYAREGDVFAGGFDVFNVSNPSAPSLETRVISDSVDVYSAVLSGNTVYLAGAVNPDKLGLETPSAMLELQLSNNSTLTGKITSLPGYAGTGIVKANNTLYYTAGNAACATLGKRQGGSGSLTLDGISLFSKSHCNAQSISVDDDTVVSLEAGINGKLHIFNSKNLSASKTIDIGAVTPEDGRNTVFQEDQISFIAMGKGGIKAFNTKDGNSTPLYSLEPENNTDPDLLANGVAFANDLVYIAHGSGGLRVARLPDDGGKLDLLGKLALTNTASANYVAIANELIFIAGGRGGLTIAKRNKLGTKTTWTNGISPILECVSSNDDGTYTAHFGYLNREENPISIPIGNDNQFSGASGSSKDRGQPIAFDTGRTTYYPNAKYRVKFNTDEQIVWKLTSRTSTANKNSKRCN